MSQNWFAGSPLISLQYPLAEVIRSEEDPARDFQAEEHTWKNFKALRPGVHLHTQEQLLVAGHGRKSAQKVADVRGCFNGMNHH